MSSFRNNERLTVCSMAVFYVRKAPMGAPSSFKCPWGRGENDAIVTSATPRLLLRHCHPSPPAFQTRRRTHILGVLLFYRVNGHPSTLLSMLLQNYILLSYIAPEPCCLKGGSTVSNANGRCYSDMRFPGECLSPNTYPVFSEQITLTPNHQCDHIT